VRDDRAFEGGGVLTRIACRFGRLRQRGAVGLFDVLSRDSQCRQADSFFAAWARSCQVTEPLRDRTATQGV